MTESNHLQNTPSDEGNAKHIIPEPSPRYKKDENGESENVETTKDKLEHTGETISESIDEQVSHFSGVNTDEGAAPIKPFATTFPVTTGEERTWAMLAHLSVLLNLITGFLGGMVALVIYFIYKDRSRFVAYHAMQAFIFQSITWIGAGFNAAVLIISGFALAFLIIPLLCLIPGFLAILLVPASLVYGVIGGVRVSNGEDFRYWLVGDWVREILEPKPVSTDL